MSLKEKERNLDNYSDFLMFKFESLSENLEGEELEKVICEFEGDDRIYPVSDVDFHVNNFKHWIDTFEARIIPGLCMTCIGDKEGTCRKLVRKNFADMKKQFKEEFE